MAVGTGVVVGVDVVDWPDVIVEGDLLVATTPHGRSLLPGPYDDLSVMAWLADPTSPADQTGLELLARWQRSTVAPAVASLRPGSHAGRMGRQLVTAARRTYETLRGHLEARGLWRLYETLERPVALVLRRMEAVGVPVIKGAVDLCAEAEQTQRQWAGWPERSTSLDGRVHPTWLTNTARTGRITARDPAVQNLPKTLRHTVAAPAGRMLVVADISGADLRAAAALSRDPRLLRMFEEGQDPYRDLGGAAGREARGRERAVGKDVALKALYDAKPHTIAMAANVPTVAVERAIRSYRQGFPRLWQWRDEALEAWRSGRALRNPWGRILVPESRTQVISHHCQSSVADLVRVAMIRLADRLPTDAAIIAQVHDELIVEAPADTAATVAAVVREEMTRRVPQLPVTLAVKVGVGSTWASASEAAG